MFGCLGNIYAQAELHKPCQVWAVCFVIIIGCILRDNGRLVMNEYI